jgi:hypothetical protein
MKELWTNWPNREIGGLQKWYTLVQYAFWLQQMMVINIAKGLLGDVLAPHYHNHFDIHELLLPQHKGWKPYSLHDGSCRYHSSRKLLFLLTPLEISNIVFYRQRNASNISAILPFAITSLACL